MYGIQPINFKVDNNLSFKASPETKKIVERSLQKVKRERNPLGNGAKSSFTKWPNIGDLVKKCKADGRTTDSLTLEATEKIFYDGIERMSPVVPIDDPEVRKIVLNC